MKLYIARDLNGNLGLFETKPKREENAWWNSYGVDGNKSGFTELYGDYPEFDSLTWEDDPIEIELAIKTK